MTAGRKHLIEMDKFNILDCTLRDGGYINQWLFTDTAISKIVNGLALSGIDFIEVGYLNNKMRGKNTTQFENTKAISRFLEKRLYLLSNGRCRSVFSRRLICL